MRYFKATIEYDGTNFVGFQWQHGARSVQSELEAAIESRTGQKIRLTGAGRTDSGVHALGQVVSFAVETRIPLDRMAIALNSALASDVSIRQVEEVGPEFNARFSASSRLYSYLILNRSTRSALFGRYSAFVPEELDIPAMQAAARLLVGELDFAAFTNELEPNAPTSREITRCTVGKYRAFVLVRMEGNAFLRGMVRTTVGTLLEVGTGKRSATDIPEILATRDRRRAGPSAPPQGLCLLRVRYGVRKDYSRIRKAASVEEDGMIQTGE